MNVHSIASLNFKSFVAEYETLEEQGFTATLAIVFAPIDTPLDCMTAFFREKNTALYGCTTAGEIHNQNTYESRIVATLFDMDASFFKTQLYAHKGDDVFYVAQTMGQEAATFFEQPSVLVASGGLFVDAEKLTYGLKAGLGADVPIFGGLAGDNLTRRGTYAFTEAGYTNSGIASVVFDNEKIRMKGMAVSGWEPLGVEHTITKAEGNIIHSINNEPALEVFVKYFGYFDNTDATLNELSTLSAQYPFQMVRPDGTTVLRSTIFGSETDGTIILAGSVQSGDKFRFSIAPGFEVLEQTVEEFKELKASEDSPEAIILYSCKGRQAAFGPMIKDEIEGIYAHWEKPMIGFFSYGEIGQTKNGSCDLHNETCCLVTLKDVSGK